MQWHSLPVAIMAGISGYAALLFIGFHFVLTTDARRLAHRENLSFALLCASVMAYDIGCAGLYNSSSIETGIQFQRLQMATAAMTGAAYLRFTWDFRRRPMSRVALVFFWALLSLGSVVTFWDSPYTLTISQPSVKHVVLGDVVDVVYYEGEPGVLGTLLFVAYFLAYGYTVTSLYLHFRREARRGANAFLLALVISFFAAVNDSLVSAGVYKFLYLFEYGIAMILMAMGYVLFIRSGELHGEIEVLNDVLAKRNADLAVALAHAQESGRAKTEFLAAISHELRTPLNAIINLPEGAAQEFVNVARARCGACNAEFELEPGDAVGGEVACPACQARGKLTATSAWTFVGDGEAARHHLTTVSRAGRHLLGLVNDMLDASKLELGRVTLARVEVDIGALAREVVDSMQSVAEKGGVVVTVTGGAGVIVLADPVKLGQVLYNLVGNAIKFSPPRSHVDVAVTQPDDAAIRIEVRDRGIGIGAEHHETIFEKFRQVEGGATRAYGGTGLGLAISKSIVELHGGRIAVASREGEGSVFSVEMPRESTHLGGDRP